MSVMRALVKRGDAVALDERPIPRAGVHDVVVRTTAASMCSADVARVSGDFAVPEGLVLGHEAVGIVHEVGAFVEGFVRGERVAAMGATPCGRCANCQRGYGGHCGGIAWGGYSFGVSRDGSMAEYFVVPDAELNLARLPSAVTDQQAVCVVDSMASGMTGPESARIPLGGTVAVFGQGHIGLAATAGARLVGAGLVVAIRARPGDDTLSRQLGADHVLNLQSDDPLERILELTDGHGVDCAFEASGVAESFPNAVKVTRNGGVICVLSSYAASPDGTLRLALNDWGLGIGDKTIMGTFCRTGRVRLCRLLRLVANGRIDITPMLTHHYEFGDAERAFADLRERRDGIIKPLVTF
jgi:threonine dehydrogenase-like Zn-dependent dehydrogenase